jgi:hypothetical protein
MTSMNLQSDEFSCAHCSYCPRHPCSSAEEVAECPNALSSTQEYARSLLAGFSQSDADELAEYRRHYGRLP